MVAKSIIDIEVNDAEFRRFEQSFAKYNESLTRQPDALRVMIGGGYIARL